MSEIPNIVLAIVGILEIVLTIALFYVGVKASKIDRLEETLSEKADQLIEAKFAVLAAEMRADMGSIKSMLMNLDGRLARGDGKFDQNDEAWRKLELKVTAALGDVRQWVLEHYATKEHMRIIECKVQALDNSFARCQARCEAEAAARG